MGTFSIDTIMQGYSKGAVKERAGFTLIELMFVIAIIGIMIGIAVPNIMQWLPNYRLKAAVNDLYSNMQKAKMEALKQNTDVIIIFSPVASAPAGRVGSYQIFIDNSPNNGIYDGGETIISQETMPANVSLYYAQFSGGTNAAGFNSRGLPWKSRIGSVRMQNSNTRYYQISLSMTGSFTVKTSNDGTTWF